MTSLIVQSLSSSLQGALARKLEPVELKPGDYLFHQGAPAGHAWFVESGMVSLVACLDDNQRVEVAVVGREGLAGLSAAFGIPVMATSGMIHLPGRAQRIGSADLQELMDSSKELRSVLLRYMEALLILVGQSAACNARHHISERLARWLLSAFDRADGPEINVTHEFLSQILGVRRAGITQALHLLEGEYAIRSIRGKVKLRDRALLERMACSCYQSATQRTRALTCVPGSDGNAVVLPFRGSHPDAAILPPYLQRPGVDRRP